MCHKKKHGRVRCVVLGLYVFRAWLWSCSAFSIFFLSGFWLITHGVDWLSAPFWYILMACTFSTDIPSPWTFKYSIETVVNRNHQLPVHTSSVPRVAWDVSAESCEIARQTPYFLPTLGQASNCWRELWRDSSGRPWDSKPSASLVMPVQRISMN